MKKANYAANGTEVRLRWTDGMFRPEGQNNTNSIFDRAAQEARAEQTFLDLLDLHRAQGRDVSHKPSVSYAPTVFAKHPGLTVSKEALQAAMERLFKARKIVAEKHGPASRNYSRVVRADESP